ncbi:hypothetical protein TRICI_006463 [Trichomonascus ciferrii]|uniref:Uncharacterized protein n=1 Tax=Trichomonascus ciferrii TaxID=44093 RepID=A0A642UH27_9ASCO|nr:hypothetical protein TRICI_006463 [Trichomonascus ciferrii]
MIMKVWSTCSEKEISDTLLEATVSEADGANMLGITGEVYDAESVTTTEEKCEKVVEKLALPLEDPYKVFSISSGNKFRNSIVRLLDANWCVRNLPRYLVPKIQQAKGVPEDYFSLVRTENLKSLEQDCMECELEERMLLSAEKVADIMVTVTKYIRRSAPMSLFDLIELQQKVKILLKWRDQQLDGISCELEVKGLFDIAYNSVPPNVIPNSVQDVRMKYPLAGGPVEAVSRQDIERLRLEAVADLIDVKRMLFNKVNQQKPKRDQVDGIIYGTRKEAGALRRMKHGRDDVQSEWPPRKRLMKTDAAFQRDEAALEDARDIMNKYKLKTYKRLRSYRLKRIIEKYDPSDIVEYINPSKFPKE